MRYSSLVAIALALSVAGCDTNKATTETKQGMVSGCEIIRIDLEGHKTHQPIYLAKCKDTATITTPAGKNDLSIMVTAVEKETAELDKKKQALQKLTQEERQLLGLE